MQYTAGQAAEATGKNITTITRAIKSGKISAQKDEGGAWRIDASELNRVFPLRSQVLRNDQMQGDASRSQEPIQEHVALMRTEMAALREQISAQSKLLEERACQLLDLKEERDRWRQQATTLATTLQLASPRQLDAERRRWWQFTGRKPQT